MRGSARAALKDGRHRRREARGGVVVLQRTLPGKERYLEHIAKYANASARSKVANAVRRGAQAHELDDELDESEVRDGNSKQ